ncbi:MAG: sulfatase-like hydrolase/transferase, partial [Polyangiaceae bacterium]|nr:sulfatase-like hydrolase/transferase [Polyangiaceae bacterium]
MCATAARPPWTSFRPADPRGPMQPTFQPQAPQGPRSPQTAPTAPTEARVPLVVSWPGHVPAAVRDEPVSHLDVLPTLVELLGLPPHPSFQGASFLRSGAVAGRGVYLNIQGLRFADALVCWPFKLFEDRTGKRSILFHLEDNPEE